MKILLGLLVPLCMYAQTYSLTTLINHAQKYNEMIKAKEITVQSKKSSIEAAEDAYWPTVDVGASHAYVSPNSLVNPGQVTNGFASVNFELYDGGRKDAQLRARRFEHQASLLEKKAYEKSVTLEIVRYYYEIQKLKLALGALYERAKEVKAQIKRIKKFEMAELATSDEIDKLQSVYDNNQYSIENTKLALETNEENLKVLSGLSAKHLRQNRFAEPKHVQYEEFEATKILAANASAVGENATMIDAGYKPQVSISDTYSKSRFNDTVASAGFDTGSFLLDHQNTLKLSVNMRVFDHGKMDKESEAVKLKKLSLLSELAHAKKEQKMHFKLARKGMQTSRSKLKSAKSALRAAKSTYKVIKEKFETGLVDNIAYLDALTQKTYSQAQYKQTQYEYEVSKSIYYYYAGKNPEEFIR